MSKIEFTRESGNGDDALYTLRIDNNLIKSGLTLREVLTEINKTQNERNTE